MNPVQTFISALLIMSSIFMGFQVDRWWEAKRERNIEKAYLHRLLLDLKTDETSLGRRIKYFTAIRGFADQGLEFLAKPEISDGHEAELVLAFYLASHAWEFTPASSTFEELKSAGNLTLIQDIELRNAIIVYHIDLTNANYVWKTPNYYRRTARSLIPANMQRSMWESCHELTDQAASQSFNTDCKLDYSKGSMRSVLERLKASPVLEGDLNFLAANTDVSLVLYNEHLDRTRELIARLNATL